MRLLIKNPLLTSVLMLVLLGISGYVWLITRPDPNYDPSFICGYPPLQQIKANLSKAEVMFRLGVPTARKVESKLSDYTFGQGQLESHIKEGWIYEIKNWHGNIEIYFDTEGRVLGTNCGYG